MCLSEKSCTVRYKCTHTRHLSICLLSIENRQISCGKSRSRLVHLVVTQSHLSLYRASMRAKSYKTMFVLHMNAPNGVVRDCACGRCAIRDVQLFWLLWIGCHVTAVVSCCVILFGVSDPDWTEAFGGLGAFKLTVKLCPTFKKVDFQEFYVPLHDQHYWGICQSSTCVSCACTWITLESVLVRFDSWCFTIWCLVFARYGDDDSPSCTRDHATSESVCRAVCCALRSPDHLDLLPRAPGH